MKIVGITAGDNIFYKNKGFGDSPELNVSAYLLNVGVNCQLQKGMTPVYNLYLGLGLFNILQFQYNFISQRKWRLRTEVPILSEYPVWKAEPESWKERLNLVAQFEFNHDNSRFNCLSVGVSYLIL